MANVEFTYQRTKSKTYKPNKLKHFEAAIGLGIYRYQLQGTNFKTDGESFDKVIGDGNTLMPSMSLGWGRTLRFIQSADLRFFTKGGVYLEVPSGIETLPHLVFEIGLASPLTSKKEKL